MTDIPQEWVENAAEALHQRCLDRWRGRKAATTAKHRVEAHNEPARMALAAVYDVICNRVRRVVHEEIVAMPVPDFEYEMQDVAYRQAKAEAAARVIAALVTETELAQEEAVELPPRVCSIPAWKDQRRDTT